MDTPRNGGRRQTPPENRLGAAPDASTQGSRAWLDVQRAHALNVRAVLQQGNTELYAQISELLAIAQNVQATRTTRRIAQRYVDQCRNILPHWRRGIADADQLLQRIAQASTRAEVADPALRRQRVSGIVSGAAQLDQAVGELSRWDMVSQHGSFLARNRALYTYQAGAASGAAPPAYHQVVAVLDGPPPPYDASAVVDCTPPSYAQAMAAPQQAHPEGQSQSPTCPLPVRSADQAFQRFRQVSRPEVQRRNLVAAIAHRRAACHAARTDIQSTVRMLSQQVTALNQLLDAPGRANDARRALINQRLESVAALETLNNLERRLGHIVLMIDAAQSDMRGASGQRADAHTDAQMNAIRDQMEAVDAQVEQLPAGDVVADNARLLALPEHVAAGASAGPAGSRRGCDPRSPGAAGGGGFGGAMAASVHPDGDFRNAQEAYDGTWEAQARLFQFGTPIARDRNHRRHNFADGSYVEIQAHQPMPESSYWRRGVITAAIVSMGAAGIALACIPGLPVALFALVAGVGGMGASMAGAFLDRCLPMDAAWQPYTARFFSGSDAAEPLGNRYFYGWARSPGVTSPITILGERNPDAFANFADVPQLAVWYPWRLGSAEVRPASLIDWETRPPATVPVVAPVTQVPQPGGVDQLIQSMSLFGSVGAAVTNDSGRDGVGGSGVGPMGLGGHGIQPLLLEPPSALIGGGGVRGSCFE